MENRGAKILILIVLNFILAFACYAHEKIDNMCGIWTWKNRAGTSYESVAIEKISDMEYFILYSSSADHILDISTVGTVVADNLIHIHKAAGEDFYVYLDYVQNSVYFLWNCTSPCHYDAEMKPVSEVFNYELNQKKQEQYEEKLKKSVLDTFKKHPHI